ncbi:hypothetical protein [Absidia glauca]|uniref:Uncharacterized protein n=1 Tax=Absidia glauca TaxID=4829 RepID=A0A168MX02_ABSGL|nr:hypothetical protein [Absidia glauca]
MSTLYGLYDFVSEHDDEISFKVDEPIVVIEADSDYMDGWWLGRNIQGKEGLFPRNYSTTIPPATLLNTPTDGPPELWDLNKVSTWLSSIGMEALVPIFIEQEITGDVLIDLQMESLKELGVSAYGKRYKIMQAIMELKEPDNSDLIRTSLESTLSKSTSSIHRPSHHQRPSSKDSSSSSSMYCFPRKAPLPPIGGAATPLLSPSSSTTKHSVDLIRPLSPPSTISTNVSRANTPSSSGTRHSGEKNIEHQKHPFASFRNSFHKKSSDGRKHSSVGEKESPLTEENVNTEAQHEGWLYKQSDKYKKKWDKRWFVLREQQHHLFYMGHPKDTRVRGIIQLHGYRIQADPSIHPGKYSFKLHHERERTFYFYAETMEAMKAWMNVLMKATIVRDYDSPVMSSNPVATIPLSVARQMQPRPPSTLFLHQDPHAVPLIPRASRSSPIISSQRCRPPHESLGILSDEDEDLIDPDQSSCMPASPSLSATKINSMDKDVIWINSYLRDQPIKNLHDGLKDGEKLLLLLESIGQKSIRRPQSASTSLSMLDNMVAAFRFMGREGVVVDGQYTIKDILDGDLGKTRLMVHAIQQWAANTRSQ